eukprot:TRINITY_DN10348_c0_g1_i1.p1 TRINITY_DN10348_c0_g1~~TRINITY_DN10348_c0_g1_i1.p1  ORF type:complete len:518 (-),score=129.06 TRINITY_DN10348_c0_g1_i1:118-1671(-)
MLLEIKKDDELDDVVVVTSSSKKNGNKKGNKKKGQTLILDWKTTGAPVSHDIDLDHSPPPTTKVTTTTTRNPGGIGAAQQAWSAVVAAKPASQPQESNAAATPSPTGPAARRPADLQSRVLTLVGMLGCSELRAMRLLELNDWHLNRAADAFFAQEGSGPAEADGPRWGPSKGQPQAKAAPQSQQQQQQKQQQQPAKKQQQPESEAADARSQPPAPSIPPPPPMSSGWQAVWNEDYQAYYYWHQPTNHTQWDAPAAEGDVEDQQEQGPTQESLISKVREETGLAEAAARGLLEQSSWDLESALWEHRKAEEREAAAREEKARREAAEAARRRAEEEAAAEAARLAELAAQEALAQRCCRGRNICRRHWQPCLSGLESCIRLIQGDVVNVTWIDDQNGWAFGNLVDDPGKQGYFPQAVVNEFSQPSRTYSAGQVVRASEPYEAPPDIGGYLSLEEGDELKVLHAVIDPAVWAFVERRCPLGGPSMSGWVPACSLADSSDTDLRLKKSVTVPGRPQRAG